MILALLLAAAAPARSQMELSVQAGTDYRAADAAMNVQYRATMAHMKQMGGLNAPDAQVGPSYRSALLASQRAWLGYRDAECAVEGYEFRGGTAEGMAGSQCLARLTRARTAQLRQMAVTK
ncbi:lysozyme inhibitor LprI family protein [uncultured Sphingomonas sp.]|uniref:lysozyme inhibitor LprI family protein n=1 Tax=uncultured Sphingomonas sp. TaxID=158754 RepID=UPI0035CC567A